MLGLFGVLMGYELMSRLGVGLNNRMVFVGCFMWVGLRLFEPMG